MSGINGAPTALGVHADLIVNSITDAGALMPLGKVIIVKEEVSLFVLKKAIAFVINPFDDF